MTDKLKKQLILNLPYLIFVYLFDKLCQGVRLAPGADASEKLLHIGQGFSAAFASLAPSFHLLDLCMGAAGAVLIRLAVYSKGKNAKKYPPWYGVRQRPMGHPPPTSPPTQTRTSSRTSSSPRRSGSPCRAAPRSPNTPDNKNILVIGGSGSGKTRFFVKPNLLTMPFLVCGHGPEGHHLTRGRRPAGAQAIPHQKPESHQLQEVHAV